MNRKKPEPARHQRDWDYSTGTGVRATERWQATHREYLSAAEVLDLDPDVKFRRLVVGAYDLYLIECEYDGHAPKPMNELLRMSDEAPTLARRPT